MSRPVYLTRRAPGGMVPEQGKRDRADPFLDYEASRAHTLCAAASTGAAMPTVKTR